MNIVIVSPSMVNEFSANGLQVFNTSIAFADAGHRVLLICAKKRRKIEPSEPNLMSQLTSIRKSNLSWTVLGWNRFSSLIGLFSIKAFLIICKRKTDLCLSRDLGLSLLLSLVGKKTVYEIHTLNSQFDFVRNFISWMIVIIQKFRLRLGRQTLFHAFISAELQQAYIRRYGAINLRSQVVPSSATSHKLSNAQNQLALSESLTAVYVGSLKHEKGIDKIVMLSNMLPNIRFLIIGGSTREHNQLTKNLNFPVNLHFETSMEYGRVHQELEKAHIALLPNACPANLAGRSRSDINHWTSPLKLFDYMAHGLAICYSNLPTIQEVLSDGVTGLMCDCSSVESWYEALLRLEKEPELRRTLGANAKRIFSEKYSLESRCEKILQL